MRLQLYWIPIRDWNISLADSQNQHQYKLQLYWIPIRDWNFVFGDFLYFDFKLQLYWIPIRDWNGEGIDTIKSWWSGLQLYWIPIRDWNLGLTATVENLGDRLQLYWIPIRDWNEAEKINQLAKDAGCNYIESLLGIETKTA